MNVSAVKLFLEVAEAGSLSRVAARRQTVQSHVSRQITDFEQQCGARLFRRTGRGVELTDLGTRAATQLRAWLQATEQSRKSCVRGPARSAAACGWASSRRPRTRW